MAKLSVSELSDLLKHWSKIYNYFTARFMPIDATDETLEEDIKTAFQKSGVDLDPLDLAALLTPDTLSYVQKEHADFCLLAKKFKNSRNSPATKKAIYTHEQKWWWTVMGWGQHKPLSSAVIKKKLLKIKDHKTLLASLKRDEIALKQTLNHKKRLAGKLPKNITRLLNAFEVLAEMHDTRKEIQMRMMSAGFLITNSLLKKTKTPQIFRNFILLDEYADMAKGVKPPAQELQRRMKAYWCQFTADGKTLMLSGKKAKNRIKQSKIDAPENYSANNVLKGASASPGKAVGRARVELNATVLNRTIKPGEILVTSQTTPEFAPAMKKAAAIVTDEGGITSHAAIVSRELKKSCVIGTKTATQMLKTGDLLEVNADMGWVKKLN